MHVSTKTIPHSLLNAGLAVSMFTFQFGSQGSRERNMQYYQLANQINVWHATIFLFEGNIPLYYLSNLVHWLAFTIHKQMPSKECIRSA
jgi:hypothetical protein